MMLNFFSTIRKIKSTIVEILNDVKPGEYMRDKSISTIVEILNDVKRISNHGKVLNLQ